MLDSSTKYYDTHTLFVKCGRASLDEIHNVFNQALENYKNTYDSNIECKFYVNLIENRENKSLGIAFVFVTNPAIYHMILGKNPDGSDRVEYTDDPNWVKPTEPVMSSPVLNKKSLIEMDWGVLMEMEEEYEKNLAKHKCPKIATYLPSLISLPPRINNDHLVIDRAIATSLDSKFMPNILKCKYIPIWVTKQHIKNKFIPYASDSNTLYVHNIKGEKCEENYPFVNITKDRVAFVIFDPNTHDARFALHMMKKTIITVGSNSTILFFGHSYRDDRDMEYAPREKHTRYKNHKKIVKY